MIVASSERQEPAQVVEVETPTSWKKARATPKSRVRASANLKSAGRHVLSGGTRHIGLCVRLEAPYAHLRPALERAEA